MRRCFVTLALSGFLSLLLAGGCSKPPETLTIAFSNDMVGQIRSCGCVAKDYGGLGRQATFVRIARDTSENFILLEGGDFFGVTINYGREKAELTMQAMSLMGYDGIVIGEKDLSLGLDFVRESQAKFKLPVVVANLRDARADSLIFSPSRVATLRSGRRVGIIGVMGERIALPPQIKPGVLKITSPADAVRAEIDRIGPDADFIVVLAHMPVQAARNLAERTPEIDLIVAGHEGRPMRKVKKWGGAYVVQVPSEGRYGGLAYAVLDENGKINHFDSEVEPLSARYPDDEAMVKLFRAYDLEIAAKEKSGIPSRMATSRRIEKPFVGDAGCRECHERIHDEWLETAHAHAFHILEEQNREYDRDCTPCHSTGFYKLGGFESLTRTPELVNVQCESCHGNGHDHAAEPDVRTPGNAKSVCVDCHNEDQSPGFSFAEEWPKIEHRLDE